MRIISEIKEKGKQFRQLQGHPIVKEDIIFPYAFTAAVGTPLAGVLTLRSVSHPAVLCHPEASPKDLNNRDCVTAMPPHP